MTDADTGLCARPYAHNAGIDELEVLAPRIGSRMKQTDQLTRIWVKSSDVGTLALMLLGSDVIDLKAQRKGVLRNAAVFATVTRALPNGPS
jgi:hypothetical protein